MPSIERSVSGDNELWTATAAVRFRHPKGVPISLPLEEYRPAFKGRRQIVPPDSKMFPRWLWRKHVRPVLIDMEIARYAVFYTPAHQIVKSGK
jgi:hypothetical protein